MSVRAILTRTSARWRSLQESQRAGWRAVASGVNSVSQFVDGWEDLPLTFAAIVPVARNLLQFTRWRAQPCRRARLSRGRQLHRCLPPFWMVQAKCQGRDLNPRPRHHHPADREGNTGGAHGREAGVRRTGSAAIEVDTRPALPQHHPKSIRLVALAFIPFRSSQKTPHRRDITSL
jgi:hypothetical protein